MPTRTRKTGEFCWINMLTPEPDQARDFFGKLLGWTFDEIPGMGHTVSVAGQVFGGLFDLNSPQTPPGTPAYIGVMVKVDSADAVCARVVALGGKALPPFDVMENGRMAVCFDPNGAGFDLWEPKAKPGTEVDPQAPGAPSWFENMTTDVEKATKFYSELFGWSSEAMPMDGFTYTSFKLGSDWVAGMLAITPDMGDVRPNWATYFTVADVDATAALAVELGGALCVPPQDIPKVGRFSMISSPQGVMFYVIKYSM